MEEEKILQILNRIKICLNRNDLYIAKEYVQLEIDNITGASEQRCKNTKYYFYDSYCKYCKNENCSKKKEKKC